MWWRMSCVLLSSIKITFHQMNSWAGPKCACLKFSLRNRTKLVEFQLQELWPYTRQTPGQLLSGWTFNFFNEFIKLHQDQDLSNCAKLFCNEYFDLFITYYKCNRNFTHFKYFEEKNLWNNKLALIIPKINFAVLNTSRHFLNCLSRQTLNHIYNLFAKKWMLLIVDHFSVTHSIIRYFAEEIFFLKLKELFSCFSIYQMFAIKEILWSNL